MKLEARDLPAALRRFDPAVRLVLLWGPDEGRARALAADVLRAAAGGEGAVERVELTGAQLAADPGRLGDEAASVSMFGARTAIFVEGAGEECCEAVSILLDAPAAGNPVVMLAGNLRKGSKLVALAEGSPLALSHACYAPAADAAAREVVRLAAAHGLRVDRAAAAMLVEASAGEIGVIERELEVLALYHDSAATPVELGPADLPPRDGEPGEAAFAALVDAVLGGAPSKLGRQLASFRAQGVTGVPLLRAVGRRLWLLLELGQAVEAGASPERAVAAAKPPVFWKERDGVTAQLRRWPLTGVRRAQARLLAAERDIKAAGSAGDLLADHALLSIARQAAAAARR